MFATEYQKKMIHRPPHIYIDREWYFITAHTIGKTPLFNSNEQKSIWVNEFNLSTKKFKDDIAAWVLLSNHYHLLCYFEESTQIPNFLKALHGVSSYRLNKFDQKQGRKV